MERNWRGESARSPDDNRRLTARTHTTVLSTREVRAIDSDRSQLTVMDLRQVLVVQACQCMRQVEWSPTQVKHYIRKGKVNRMVPCIRRISLNRRKKKEVGGIRYEARSRERYTL